MKKKKTLLFSIVALVVCIGLLAFGVYAANNAYFTLSNNIQFSPSGMYVHITGSVSGYDKFKTQTIEDYSHGTNTEANPNPTLPAWDDDKLKTLCFKDSETPIVFTFVVTNTGEMPFTVDITNVESSDFLVRTVTKIQGGDVNGSRLPNGQTLTLLNPGSMGIIMLSVIPQQNAPNFSQISNNFTVELNAVR